MRPSKNELTRVSVHEAGHFVVGRWIGYEAIEMRLVQDRPGSYSGYVRFKASRAEDLLTAEVEGKPLEAVRERWGVNAHEFERLCRILSARRRSLVQKLMARSLAGVAADTELGGGNATVGEGDYLMARNFARAIVPDALVAELMEKVYNDVRQQAAGPLRAAILTAAERLRRRRHFDTKALDALWHEVCPGPWHGLAKIQGDRAA